MIQIINYGVGNFLAVENMLNRIGADAEVIHKPNEIRLDEPNKIIFPGVGSFDAAMSLIKKNGWVEPLNEFIKLKHNKILGICLGMQLLFEESEEGKEKGLGWIPGKVLKFDNSNFEIRIPHMGWSEIDSLEDAPLFKNIPKPERFYFAHSFFAKCSDENMVQATCMYGFPFTCSVKMDNIFGVQFHPEKSHKFGLKLLENFVNL